MSGRGALVGAVIHVISWVGAMTIVGVMFSQSDSRIAYGLISGWWCALYTTTLSRAPLSSTGVVVAAFVLVDLGATLFGASLLHHDRDSTIGFTDVVDTLLRALVFASPIPASAATRVVQRRIRGGKSG